jgi:hypothetical protein
MRARGEIENLSGYGVQEYSDLSVLHASLFQEDLDYQHQRSIWDRILGVATMALISVCGWAVIIEIARLLAR